MPRWGMVLDLDRCIGCYSCTVACHIENGSPPGIWYAPVYEREAGTFPHVTRLFLPTLCMHCEDAPCRKACPSGAISRRNDGIVLINQDLCCGSRACVAACPYGAMHFHGDGRADFEGQPTPFEQSFHGKWEVGTVQKCTFCVHRIDQGIPLPACVEACPTGCRIFGDLDDPESPPSKLIANHRAFLLRPEAGTHPSVLYVTPGSDRSASSMRASPTQPAGPEPQAGASEGSQMPSGNAFTARLEIEAKRQTVWGLNHALWFLSMGLGSGLYLNRLLFGIDVGRILGLPLADVLGIILVSIGGVILIADLGKPLRFLRALRNVRSSWISPGAIADFIFLFLGGLLILPYLSIGGHRPLAELPWAPGTGLAQVLTWITAAAALLIIVYPGLVLSSPRAIPFWHTRLIPLQYLGSALASAAGVAYLVGPRPSRITAAVALISVLATLVFSLAHIRKARSQRGAARISADEVLKGSLAPDFLWGNLVLGLMVPGAILALSLASGLAGGVLALAGVLLLAGNFLSKYAVIKAGYYAPLL